MAIIIDNKGDYKKFSKKIHPDKVALDEKKIANQIIAKTNPLNEEAEKNGYPFEYIPKKDEYCFLISKIYLADRVINNTLKDIFITNCEEFQKHNFSFEDQILVTKHLKDISEEKREDVLKAHEILNNPKGHSNSELNDSLDCVMGISDEC